jgi:hypothetical protein
MSRLTEFHHRDPRHLASSRAIAHAYATSSGLAWSACFSFSLFGRQRLRWENTRSMQVQAMWRRREL